MKTTEETNAEIDLKINEIKKRAEKLDLEIYGKDGVGGCKQCDLSDLGCPLHSEDIKWLRKVSDEIKKLEESKIATEEDIAEFSAWAKSLRGGLH